MLNFIFDMKAEQSEKKKMHLMFKIKLKMTRQTRNTMHSKLEKNSLENLNE